MDPTPPRIEIFKPFGEAFDLTKKILFQPFDLGKWFVVGFAAWLATFFSGGGANFQRFNRKDWNWQWRSEHQGPPFSWHDAPPWVVPLIIFGVCFFLALCTLLIWLNARGRFMFTDCIVRNRGAIAEPWREYRKEGNSYFVFRLVVSFVLLVVFGGLATTFVLNAYWHHAIIPLAILILAAVIFALFGLVVGFIMHLMVPVMYRQRCDAIAAFRQVWGLMAAHPGVFVLYVLFYVVLAIAAAAIGCVAACVTCCIAAIPYLGTVILLPVVMCLFAFALCFLRQFGDSYDVWAAVRPELPPTLPVATAEPPAAPIPPVQDPPPPA